MFVVVATSDGSPVKDMPLAAQPLSKFYASSVRRLAALKIDTRIWPVPVKRRGSFHSLTTKAIRNIGRTLQRTWEIPVDRRHGAKTLSAELRWQVERPAHLFWEASTSP